MDRFAFTSSALLEKDPLEFMHEIYGSLAPVDLDPLDAPFSADISVLSLTNLAVAEVSTSACTTRRTPALVADGNDDLVLQILSNGSAAISQPGGDDFYVRAGEPWLAPNDCVGQIAYDGGPRGLSVAIPRADLTPRLVGNHAGRMKKLPPSPELDLFAQYATSLLHAPDHLAPATARLAATHLQDLAALALGAKHDDAHLAQHRGLRAARYGAVTADILANLANHALSLEWLAVRHGISPSYLRALFYGERTSFSDFVRNARLDKARDLLTDPRFMHYTITAIAAEVGFGDLSWFNQMFRRRFAMTPSDLRALAREDGTRD